MSDLQIRIPFGLGELLQDTVFRRGPHEEVAFGLVSHTRIGLRDILFVRRVLTLPESDYINTSEHGAAWKGSAMIPVMRRAIDEDLGILVFHSHPHCGRPLLSDDDWKSTRRLIPVFQGRMPRRPHGSVVLSRTHAGGAVFMPNEEGPRSGISIRWLGTNIIDWPAADGDSEYSDDTSFQSQALVVGGSGQKALRKAKVAVVGLSGGGSHVVQQLSHMGIGEILLIDPDRSEQKHRHRLVGLTALSAWMRQKKTNVMAGLIRRIGLGTRFRRIAERIPEPGAVEAIKGSDIVVGCVDNLHARADLQELALRFLIPYVDIGVTIRAVDDILSSGPRLAIGGNVLTSIPGGFCLWCCDFLSDQKLALELAGPNRSYFQNQKGEAQVIGLNGLVASQAVNEVLQLLTGFAGAGIRKSNLLTRDGLCQRGFRKLDGTNGELQDWGAVRNPDCSRCSTFLARGVVAWSARL